MVSLKLVNSVGEKPRCIEQLATFASYAGEASPCIDYSFPVLN